MSEEPGNENNAERGAKTRLRAWRARISAGADIARKAVMGASRQARKGVAGVAAQAKAKISARKPAPEKRRPGGPTSLVGEAIGLAASLGFAGAAAALFVAFVLLAPQVGDGADLWAVNRQASIIILDRKGEEVAARGARYGQSVGVDDLPDYLVAAILSTEDRRFYEHAGVDIRGTLRAFFANLQRGGLVEGGSTITQQLARNLYLGREKTYLRKAREALLALWLEGRYSKDQILSLYLNRIYFGAGAYGIDAAARTYFGKSARDVTLAEAVMLAGLPKAPSMLAPTQNPDAAQRRAAQVLENLRETGAVTEFAAREAQRNPPVIRSGGDAELGWFFDYVAAKARSLAGGRQGDLVVTTTLDRDMQRAAEAAVRSVMGVDARLAGAEQAALVAYDAGGAMRAMVGGRSYNESQFNRAVQARRQPGSAFKPFVYVAALEAGLTPNAVFVDQPVDIEGWRPVNYVDGYQGPMRITEAVAKSVNTIAVQVSEYVGREKVAEAARRLGIVSDIPAVRSIALGGVNVTLEELTAAYLPFPNGGLLRPAYVIERIEDQNFEVVFERREIAPGRVLAPEVAEQMNHLLFQVMHAGTGAGASLGRRPAAGKTGTTNDWRDAWFVGYTAQLTAGVWVGNDNFQPMEGVTGGQLPARIWRAFMTAAHQDLPVVAIPGAHPAAAYGDESALVGFYTDVLRDLQRVRRDGDARRASRRR